MKNKLLNKIISYIVCIMLLMVALPASAEEDSQNVDEAQSFMDSIVSYKLKESGASSIQQWIDDELVKDAGIGSEWYVVALSQSGTYNFGAYEDALMKYLSENEVHSASSRQKYALALIASGSTDPYIDNVLNDSIGQQGVMSWVFGLHLLNNGYSSDEHSVASVKEKLLSLQLDDGGWAVMGEKGDVDVTAMVVQALAPYYANDMSVKAAIDKALQLLSDRQLDSGDYSSYGVSNPESTIQVIVALSSLGIDCQNDNRFIKNGNTLFDGMSRYQLKDGGFCHALGEDYSESATAQVFYGMVAYHRMEKGQGSLYIFDTKNNGNDTELEEMTSNIENEKKTELNESISAVHTEQSNDNGYKWWVTIAIIITAGVICSVMYLFKKRNSKNFITICGVAAVAVIIVWITDFQKVDNYYDSVEATKEDTVGTVTLTIRCDAIAGETDNEYIPDDGIILETTEFDIAAGDTVYDILTEAAAKQGIHLETTGSINGVYVEGINYIYELAYGDLSGWIFHVNDASSSVSCGEYELTDGDKIEWHYTLQLGKDIQ